MKTQQKLDCNLPLTGKRVRLHRLGADHVDVLMRSFANDRFWRAYRINQSRDLSRAQLLQHLEFEHEHLPAQVGKIEWLIERLPDQPGNCGDGSSSKDGMRAIGLASLSAFDASRRQAEFLLGFFNEAETVTGLGLEASLLVLSYAFNTEQLHKLLSYVYANNATAQKSTLSLGFTNKQVLESHLYATQDNDYKDVYLNEFLASEYYQNHRLSRLSQRLLGYDVTVEQQHAEKLVASDNGSVSLNAKFTLER